MSIAHVRAALEDQRTAGATRLVLLVLAERASAQGVCWPSLATIKREANASHASVLGALNELEALGYIHRNRGGGRRKSTLYRVKIAPRETGQPLTCLSRETGQILNVNRSDSDHEPSGTVNHKLVTGMAMPDAMPSPSQNWGEDLDIEERQTVEQIASLIELAHLPGDVAATPSARRRRRAAIANASEFREFRNLGGLAWINQTVRRLVANAADPEVADVLAALRRHPTWAYPDTAKPNAPSQLMRGFRRLEYLGATYSQKANTA